MASDDDADNLYISLSARNASRTSRSSRARPNEDAEKKLLLAGADRVVLPYTAAGRTMANLVLKPQVMSFLDAVTTATGPDLHMVEIKVHGSCANAGSSIREIRVRHATGAIIVALRKRDGTFDTTPEPDARIEPGDVIVGVGTSEELQRLEDLFARRKSPLPTDPVNALAERVGAGVELERPSDAEHGDYATNAALRLAGARRQAPRELAAELVEGAQALPEVERAEIAGPGFVNLFLADAWFDDALASILDAGEKFGGGSAADARAASRSRWCRRIRPARCTSRTPGTAPTATRSRACSSSADTTVEREYYYNDAGSQMDRFRASVEAARRGEETPGGRLSRRLHQGARGLPGDPVEEMLHRIEASLERFRVHFDSWEKQSVVEESADRAAAAPRHLREGRRDLGALVSIWRRRGSRAHPLGWGALDLPRGGRPLSRSTSSSEASTG